MKEIACTIETVASRVSIKIVDRTGVRLIKTINTWKGRSWRSNSPSYSFNKTFLHRRLTTCRSYWFENLWKQIPLSRSFPDFLVFLVLITWDANLHLLEHFGDVGFYTVVGESWKHDREAQSGKGQLQGKSRRPCAILYIRKRPPRILLRVINV